MGGTTHTAHRSLQELPQIIVKMSNLKSRTGVPANVATYRKATGRGGPPKKRADVMRNASLNIHGLVSPNGCRYAHRFTNVLFVRKKAASADQSGI